MEIAAIERKALATAIADRLRQTILSGRIRPGERLPPERELAQVLKVTRTTLREAVKILETLRLVVVRQGDGVRVRDFLCGTNLDILADLLFRTGTLDASLLDNVLEARAVFGMALARLAARRRTEAHVEEYRRRVEALAAASGDTGSLQDADLACFDLLADAGGNLVFVFLLNSIRAIYLRHREVFEPLYRDPASIVASHRDLLAAMEASDPEAAARAAERLLRYPDPRTSWGAAGSVR